MTGDVQRVVQAELDAMVAADTQLGIQVAVYQHGQLIVDAWSGHTEPTRSAPVRSDTLFPIFSCSKGLMYTTVHLLAERGELDYDARVSDYWPEFGRTAKKRRPSDRSSYTRPVSKTSHTTSTSTTGTAPALAWPSLKPCGFRVARPRTADCLPDSFSAR